MSDLSERRRRRVAVNKKIGSLNKDDSRVAVIGAVVNIDKESLIFTIEDPSGELTIISPNEEMINKLDLGKIVRVIGLVLPYDGGVELRAELIQDFNDIDKELFQLIHNLMK